MNRRSNVSLVLRTIVAVAALATLESFPSYSAERPFLKCAPRVLSARDTLVLSMSMPHPAELAVTHPDGTVFFLVYEPDAHSQAGSAPLYAKKVFGRLRAHLHRALPLK